MTYQPELLVTAGNLHEVDLYLTAGATAINIGDQKYGVRMPGNFSIADIVESVKLAHAKKAKIYVSVNNIMDNAILTELSSYLAELSHAGIDGIVFGDPAVLMSAKKNAPGVKLHWNAEMTSTNYVTANYWGRKGASRVVLARELNMEQVLEFKEKAEVEVQVQVHGITNIYHSKRNLVKSYFTHVGGELQEQTAEADRGLFLIEQERQDERYPVYEDANGTHIMSSDDICMLENLHELLEGGVDSLKIECLLKSASYNVTVIQAYRKVMNAYLADPQGYSFDEESLTPIKQIQDPERELSFGFFYKEQVY